MTANFYLGLDLGQARDHTALTLLEESLWLDWSWRRSTSFRDEFRQSDPAVGWHAPSDLTVSQAELLRSFNYHRGRPDAPPLALRHLDRVPLGTSYPAIVEKVVALLHTAPLDGKPTSLVVDATGVGAPVVDLFRQANLGDHVELVPVTITGGFTVGHDLFNNSYTTPKRDLVSSVAVLLEQRRLKIAAASPEAPTLVRELQEFKRRVTPAGSDSYASWRESTHDDLVLATALACWYREYQNALLDQQNARLARRDAS